MKIMRIFKKHKCKYNIKLYNIFMENNTNHLISQCECGKTNMRRVHRESESYKDWIYTDNYMVELPTI